MFTNNFSKENRFQRKMVSARATIYHISNSFIFNNKALNCWLHQSAAMVIGEHLQSTWENSSIDSPQNWWKWSLRPDICLFLVFFITKHAQPALDRQRSFLLINGLAIIETNEWKRWGHVFTFTNRLLKAAKEHLTNSGMRVRKAEINRLFQLQKREICNTYNIINL